MKTAIKMFIGFGSIRYRRSKFRPILVIKCNSYNIFMVVFINIGLAYSPVNSANLSCSSEVSLTCLDTYTKYKHIGNRKNESKMSADF